MSAFNVSHLYTIVMAWTVIVNIVYKNVLCHVCTYCHGVDYGMTMHCSRLTTYCVIRMNSNLAGAASTTPTPHGAEGGGGGGGRTRAPRKSKSPKALAAWKAAGVGAQNHLAQSLVDLFQQGELSGATPGSLSLLPSLGSIAVPAASSTTTISTTATTTTATATATAGKESAKDSEDSGEDDDDDEDDDLGDEEDDDEEDDEDDSLSGETHIAQSVCQVQTVSKSTPPQACKFHLDFWQQQKIIE